MTSFRDVLERTRQEIREVDVAGARALLENGAAALDVREGEEVAQGAIPNAVQIPRGYLELRVEDALPDKARPVVVYCAGGTRSVFAAKTLGEMGYADVVSLAGGFTDWAGGGAPWEMPRLLTPEQRRRYSRHLLIPEVGERGQQALLDARVLLVGAGGLGSPAALYLAAAGVGTLGVVDADVVDESNLQRQVIHTVDRVGTPKVESAKQTVQALNPDVRVETHETRLTKTNALDLLANYDVILDGSDNFATRYVLNDACVLLRKPNVHGSIFRFDGQATTFVPADDASPCYRCLFPAPPPPELAPSCAEAGVLGLLPGVVGLIQATEVAKLILGIGDPLVGRLLTYDALSMTFRDLRISRDPGCPMCGSNGPDSLDDIEYSDVACAIPVGAAQAGV